jgi:hypothetical protein
VIACHCCGLAECFFSGFFTRLSPQNDVTPWRTVGVKPPIARFSEGGTEIIVVGVRGADK